MANTGSKIYRPIRQIQDIRKVLGVNGGTATLCTSANINEKSACKPTNIQGYSLLTQEQRIASNYSTHVGIYYNAISLARAIASKSAWGYDKPQSPYYRQGDFDGYNHLADDWIKIEPQSDVISYDRNLAIDIYGNNDALPGDISALLEITRLGYLAQYDELNFGFLVRGSAFTETSMNCYYIPLTGTQTIRDIVDNGKVSIPSGTFDTIGNWYIIPVFTTAKYEEGNRVYINSTDSFSDVWLPLPYSNIARVEVVASTTDYPIDMYIDIEMEHANASISSRGIVTLSNVIISVKNNDPITPYRVVISSASITSGVVTGTVELEGGHVNINANSVATTSIQSTQVQFEMADSSIERLAIEVEYYIDTYSSQRRTKYLYIDLV